MSDDESQMLSHANAFCHVYDLFIRKYLTVVRFIPFYMKDSFSFYLLILFNFAV